MTPDLSPLFDQQAANDLSAYLYAVDKDTPAKTWWDADPFHPAIARALRIDRQAEGAIYALAPFRLARIEEKPVILVAHPTPRILGPVDPDHLGIEQVIAWDPVTGSVSFPGDTTPDLFGAFTDAETGTLYADAQAFFVAWMRERAAHFVRWRETLTGQWAHPATETDLVPGKLIVGAPEKIRWRPASMPRDLACVGIDARQVNRLLLKSAALPMARNNNNLRVAA